MAWQREEVVTDAESGRTFVLRISGRHLVEVKELTYRPTGSARSGSFEFYETDVEEEWRIQWAGEVAVGAFDRKAVA